MQATQDYTPFDSEPEVFTNEFKELYPKQKLPEKQIVLKGNITYYTIEGKGMFQDNDGNRRPMLNVHATSKKEMSL